MDSACVLNRVLQRSGILYPCLTRTGGSLSENFRGGDPKRRAIVRQVGGPLCVVSCR